jgi:hypothetical protein
MTKDKSKKAEVAPASALAPSGVSYLVFPAPSGSNITVFADSLSVEGGALVFRKGTVITEVFAPGGYKRVEKN